MLIHARVAGKVTGSPAASGSNHLKEWAARNSTGFNTGKSDSEK